MTKASQKFCMGMAAVVAAVVLVAGSLRPAEAQPQLPDSAAGREYVGNSQCKMCHNNDAEGGQFGKWQGMHHAKALETLKSDAAKSVAEGVGLTKPPHEAPECLKCHVTGYDAATASAPSKIKLTEGVQCESCHGPMSEHLKDAKTLKFKPAAIADIDILAHMVVPDEATCRGCHNDSSPTWKADRYTLDSGETTGFDYAQAWAKIAHDYPEGVLEEKYDGQYPVD